MKTWFVDIDGTIVEHRSNKEIGEGTHEKLLPGSKEFLEEARENGDQIILTTARLTIHSEHTERMLDDFGIPYDEIVICISRATNEEMRRIVAICKSTDKPIVLSLLYLN